MRGILYQFYKVPFFFAKQFLTAFVKNSVIDTGKWLKISVTDGNGNLLASRSVTIYKSFQKIFGDKRGILGKHQCMFTFRFPETGMDAAEGTFVPVDIVDASDSFITAFVSGKKDITYT